MISDWATVLRYRSGREVLANNCCLICIHRSLSLYWNDHPISYSWDIQKQNTPLLRLLRRGRFERFYHRVVVFYFALLAFKSNEEFFVKIIVSLKSRLNHSKYCLLTNDWIKAQKQNKGENRKEFHFETTLLLISILNCKLNARHNSSELIPYSDVDYIYII